jgi:hypothetical protein
MGILEKHIIFLAYSTTDVINTQNSKGELIVVYNGSMIPKIVVFGIGRGNPKSIVGVAVGRDVAGSKFEDGCLQGFVTD